MKINICTRWWAADYDCAEILHFLVMRLNARIYFEVEY